MLNIMTTRFPLILLLNVAGLALFFSWYIPANHGFWFPLDSGLFHFFNQALVKSDAFLWLVAITNNRAFDGISLLAMGGLMLSFWLKEDGTGRRRILIIGLVMLLAAVVINQLAQHLMPVKRASPSLSFPICLPARDDWRSLADGYCRGFSFSSADWSAVGADDPLERSPDCRF